MNIRVFLCCKHTPFLTAKMIDIFGSNPRFCTTTGVKYVLNYHATWLFNFTKYKYFKYDINYTCNSKSNL